MPTQTSAQGEPPELISPSALFLDDDRVQIIGVTVDGTINDLTEVRVRLFGPPNVSPGALIGEVLELKLPDNDGNLVVYGGEIFEVSVLGENAGADDERWLYDLMALPKFANARYGRKIAEFRETMLEDVLLTILAQYYLNAVINLAADSIYGHLLQFIETDYDFFKRCLQRNGANFAVRVNEMGSTTLCVFQRSGSWPSFAVSHTLDLESDYVVQKKVKRDVEREEDGQDDEALLSNLPYGHVGGSTDPFSGIAATATAAPGIKTVNAFDRNYLSPTSQASGLKQSAEPFNASPYGTHTDSVFPAFAPDAGGSDRYAAGWEASSNTGSVEFQVALRGRTEIQVGDMVQLANFRTPDVHSNKTFLVVRQRLVWDWARGRAMIRLNLRDINFIGPPMTHLNPPYRGLLTGIVITAASDDPASLGRVKVKFPVEPDMDGAWCRVVRPFAGDQRGIQFDPDLNDEVLVGFLHNDPDRPIVMGSLHFGGQTQPFASQPFSGAYVAGIKMQSGNELSFHETDGEEKIYTHAVHDQESLVDNDKTTTVENDKTLTVNHDMTTTVENDKTLTVNHDMTTTVANNKTLTVNVDAETTVEGNKTLTVNGDAENTVGGAMTLDTTGETTITSQGAMSLEGQGTITISDTQKIEIKVGGSMIKIEQAKITLSSAQIVLDASGQLEATGASTKVSGSAMVEIQGGMVKIN